MTGVLLAGMACRSMHHISGLDPSHEPSQPLDDKFRCCTAPCYRIHGAFLKVWNPAREQHCTAHEGLPTFATAVPLSRGFPAPPCSRASAAEVLADCWAGGLLICDFEAGGPAQAVMRISVMPACLTCTKWDLGECAAPDVCSIKGWNCAGTCGSSESVLNGHLGLSLPAVKARRAGCCNSCLMTASGSPPAVNDRAALDDLWRAHSAAVAHYIDQTSCGGVHICAEQSYRWMYKCISANTMSQPLQPDRQTQPACGHHQ